MKIKILFIALLISSLSWGQATLPLSRTTWSTGAPTGWTDGNGGTPAYTSSTACSGNNGGRLDNNGEYYTVYFNSTPNQLSYAIRLTATATSSLLVEESPDGTSWSTIVNHTSIGGTTCATFTSSLLSASRYVRWTYTKVAQNLVLDDVTISIPTCTPAADPSGSISGTTPACNSTSLSFSGSVSPPLYYYWQTSASGQDMTYNAASPLTVNTAGSTNHYVRTYDSSTTCWSTNATANYPVTININPVITGSPANSSISETGTTSFSVTATNPGVYQWQVDFDGDGSNDSTVTDTGVYSGATTGILTITGATLAMSGYKYQCIVYAVAPCVPPAVSSVATLTVMPLYDNKSDLFYVPGSSPATISSLVNNASPLTSSTGVQAMQFLLRDGGATFTDTDALPTILTGFTIAQSANTATDWSAAIKTIALFDGTTYIANGVISASSIVFSGLTVSTLTDGGSKTLSLRMSLNCPLGTVLDGEYFGFSISNVNTTVAASGTSHMTTFTAIKNVPNTGATLKIAVVATKLVFTTQPTSTGQGNSMSAVVVKATDSCGNVDVDYTGTISLVSSGTMTAVTPIAAVAGVVTFSGIIHTATGTSLQLTASATGLTSGVSGTFDISVVTTLQAGDLAVLAVNTTNASGDDEISFVSFVDITPGTRIDITDNAYQKCGTTNGWGISEGWMRLERSNSTLTKGTIITITVNNTTGIATIVSPDPSNWVSSKPQPSSQGVFNLNPGGEQLFFMSGGTVGGTNASTATSDGGTYSGNFLFGFNTKGNVWTPACANAAGGGTTNSDKPKNFDCFLVWPTSQSDFNKYTGPMTDATERDWIIRISDSTNWTGYSNNTNYVAGPNFYGATINILAGGYTSGTWIGDTNTNWFECANWQARKVPDSTVNVVVGASAVQGVTVDATATNASAFSNLAQCNNLTVSNYNLKAEASASNILEVYGNLTISGTGTIDMDDSSSVTADGIIKLYGNWTNSVGNTAFSEGNGTVQFTGTGTQVVSNVTPEGTETFYDVVLNNNFDTTVSNDLIASNNLTVNASKTLTVDAAGYVRVNNKLSNNGNVIIESGGQLIQVNDSDTNDGTYTTTKFQVKRTAMAKSTDYVYWSSPISTFDVSGVPTNYRYSWNTTYVNANGTQGNWVPASGNMAKGKGYIALASNGSSTAIPLTATFSGSKPNNGASTFTVYRGNYTGPDYDADASTTLNADTTKYDDNWNITGNPYPSAIDAESFLVLNQTVIEGSVWIWKHGLVPNSTTNPFYANFSYNYSSSDYLKYNGLGSTEPDTFAGKIASGQGFMISMKDVGSLFAAGATTNLDVYSSTISFNNSLRSDSSVNPYMPQSNTDFYRMSNQTNAGNPIVPEEKHRIWLDIINDTSKQTDRMLLGYSTNSTLGRDNLYDCIFVPRGSVSLYSLIDDKSFIIQGRPLPFDENDQVPLGISIVEGGSHTIAIKKTDGLFLEDTNIYLEDKYLQIVHDLRQAPYVFTSAKGKFENRFVLRYKTETLGNPNFDNLEETVIATSKLGEMAIQSYVEKIEQITVYDILGRQLLMANTIDAYNFVTSDIAARQQAIIVKIKLANGAMVTRKIIL
jgi:hypothetical protein